MKKNKIRKYRNITFDNAGKKTPDPKNDHRFRNFPLSDTNLGSFAVWAFLTYKESILIAFIIIAPCHGKHMQIDEHMISFVAMITFTFLLLYKSI